MTPQLRTIAGLLAEQAAARDSAVYVHVDGEDVTFAELHDRSGRFASSLQGYGVGHGDTVCLALHNTIEFLVAAFGLAAIGAVQVPLDPHLTDAQLRYILDDALPVMVVAVPEFLAEHAETIRRGSAKAVVVVGAVDSATFHGGLSVIGFDELLAAPTVNSNGREVQPSDPYCLIYTSGTTGSPKGVLLCHEHELTLADNVAAAIELTADDCFYNFFPLHHNTGQGIIALSALAVGARMLLVDRFTRTRFWHDVCEHGCTVFYAMGTLLEMLVRDPDGADASVGHGLRAGWGIAISDEQAKRFADAFDVGFVTGYGSTEVNMVAISRLDQWRPGAAGRVLDDFEVAIVDDHDAPIAVGAVGEIVVRPRRPYVTALGYWRKPETTLTAWRNLWMHTGDAGSLDSDGYLTFVDRLGDVIRHRGNNVSSASIEQVVGSFDGVAEVAAIPVPTEFGGFDQDVCAVIVATTAIDVKALLAHCETNLPTFAVPRYIATVYEMPKTETGKIKKHELRARDLHVSAWDAGGRAQRKPLP